MKISSLGPTAFNGNLWVDPSSKFANDESIKEFGVYVKNNTRDDLDVFIGDMPQDQGKRIQIIDREDDYVDRNLVEQCGEIPKGYERSRMDTRLVSATENLNIRYSSPRTFTKSGFYFDRYDTSENRLKFLKQNLKINAGLDVIG